jgi:site-specific recombinase XerD
MSRITGQSPFADAIPVFMQAKRLSPMTQRDYSRYLREFDDFMDHDSLEGSLTLDNVAEFVTERRQRGPFAAHNATMALKSFAKWASKAKLVTVQGGTSILAGLEAPHTPKSTRTAFTDKQLGRIFIAIENREGADRLRARAYMWLLFACGLRKNEARQLALADLHLDPSTNRSWVHVRAHTSKGQKERRVRIDRLAVPAILDYIKGDRPEFAGDEGDVDTLFLTESGKPFKYNGFSTWADRIFTDIEEATGIHGSSHIWRHTWATMFHRASTFTGQTVYDLMRQGGWADEHIPLTYTHERPLEEMLDMPSHLSAMAERKRAS